MALHRPVDHGNHGAYLHSEVGHETIRRREVNANGRRKTKRFLGILGRVLVGIMSVPFLVVPILGYTLMYGILALFPVLGLILMFSLAVFHWIAGLPLRLWKFSVSGKYPGGNEISCLSGIMGEYLDLPIWMISDIWKTYSSNLRKILGND